MRTSIIRRKRYDRFTIMPNNAIEDDRLSFEALGTLTYLRSRPDDWSIHTEQLRKRGSIGRDKMYRILHELIECGYLHHQRHRDGDGSFTGATYIVYDEPLPDPEALDETPQEPPHPENPDVDEKPGNAPRPDLPDTAHPRLADPRLENPDVYKRLTGTKNEQVPKAGKGEDDDSNGHLPLSLPIEPSSAREAELAPRTKAWAVIFWRLIEANTPAATKLAKDMHTAAHYNRAFKVPEGVDLPSDEERKRLVRIDTAGDQFAAWRKHLGARSPSTNIIWLERQAFGLWGFFPSELPPVEHVEQPVEEMANG